MTIPGVAVDSAATSTWPISDNDEIRKITPSGVGRHLAGSAGQAGSSNGTGTGKISQSRWRGGGQRGQRLRGRHGNNHEIRKISPVWRRSPPWPAPLGDRLQQRHRNAVSFVIPTARRWTRPGNVYVARARAMTEDPPASADDARAWPAATRRPSPRPSTPRTRARARRSPPAGSVNDGNGGQITR